MWLHPRVLFEVSKWSLTWSFKEWAASVNWRQVQSKQFVIVSFLVLLISFYKSNILFCRMRKTGCRLGWFDPEDCRDLVVVWDGQHQVWPSVTSLRPPASSQDWLLISLEIGDMGKGPKEKRQDVRTLFERLVLIFCFQVLNWPMQLRSSSDELLEHRHSNEGR